MPRGVEVFKESGEHAETQREGKAVRRRCPETGRMVEENEGEEEGEGDKEEGGRQQTRRQRRRGRRRRRRRRRRRKMRRRRRRRSVLASSGASLSVLDASEILLRPLGCLLGAWGPLRGFLGSSWGCLGAS
eukprot:6527071-Pyramimonas_sp.AAC.1